MVRNRQGPTLSRPTLPISNPLYSTCLASLDAVHCARPVPGTCPCLPCSTSHTTLMPRLTIEARCIISMGIKANTPSAQYQISPDLGAAMMLSRAVREKRGRCLVSHSTLVTLFAIPPRWLPSHFEEVPRNSAKQGS